MKCRQLGLAAWGRGRGMNRMMAFGLILLLSVCSLQAGDVDDLKESFETALRYLENKDLNRFLNSFHPEAVLFVRNQIHPIDRVELGERGWKEMFESFFSQILSVGYTQKAIQFRVIGDTGIVWGLTRLAVDQKYVGGWDQATRLTAVFVKVNEDWKIAHWNDAPRPRGGE